MILFSMLDTCYLSSFFPTCYFNKVCFELPQNLTRLARVQASMGQDVPISEKGALSFLLFLSKQCLVENIQRKFQKNSSVTLISAKSP